MSFLVEPLQALCAALVARQEPVPEDASQISREYLLPRVELLDRLHLRYAVEPVPPCRVCGGELGVSGISGGCVTYACPRPEGVSIPDHQDHWEKSQWSPRRRGDEDVIALVDAVRTFLGSATLEVLHELAEAKSAQGRAASGN